MEPNFPTSFIPKRPVSSEPVSASHRSRTVGLLSFVAVIVVIATILAYGAVYLYEIRLKGQKVKIENSIDGARDGLGTEFVTDMKRLSARIEGVKSLLKSHIVVSPIFDALQETTLRSVQYKSFGYAITTDTTTKTQMVKVDLAGTAKSYATIALQSDAFSQNELIKNPVFSDLTVDEKTGRVGFKLTFNVTPTDLSYQKFVDRLTASQQSAVAPAITQ